MKEKAFITLLDNEDYIYSVIACYSSWLKTNSKYPFYCACTINVPQQTLNNLAEMNIPVIKLDNITGINEMMDKLRTSGFSSWAPALQKLAIYGLEQFSKIVFLDADTYVFQNIDELFEYPCISGVEDGLGRNVPSYKFVKGDDYFKKFNAGMLVLEPSKELFNRCLTFIRNIKLDRPWADQMILSELYPNWQNEPEKHLPIYYNCFGRHIYEYEHNIKEFSVDKIKVMHLVGRKMSPKYGFENITKDPKHNSYSRLLNKICLHVNSVIESYQKNNKLMNLKKVKVPFVCDLVVPYVDASDANWQLLFNQYNPDIYNSTEAVNAINRFRGQGDFFRYFFRCIEKNVPWINKIHLIVQSESQVPNWINRDKVNIVYHRDIIPSQLLPTFNSTCIEMFIPKIKDLSEYFIYTNDDNFVVNQMTIENFFKDGKPVKKTRTIKVSSTPTMYDNHLKNSYNIIYGDKNNEYCYIHDHSMRPLLKSACEECFDTYYKEIMASCTQFRNERNFNIYIYDNYIIKNRETIAESVMTLNIYAKNPSRFESALASLNNSTYYKFLNICDNASDLDVYKNAVINRYFNSNYPNKSIYEVNSFVNNNQVDHDNGYTVQSYNNHDKEIEKINTMLGYGWISKEQAQQMIANLKN